MKIQKKATINDIARVAGVSLATVDRVLNERPGVRSATIEKVKNAIDELGFVRDPAAVNLGRRRFIQLKFILPDTGNEFFQALHHQIAMQKQQFLHQRVSIETCKVPPFDPEAVVSFLDDLSLDSTEGVAVLAPETPSVRDAVSRARSRGISVVSFVSDLPSSDRDRFVGIDNVAAGRTAAELMGRFVQNPGNILVITGSRLARDHIERRNGFDSVIHEQFPHLNVLASIEGRDDPEVIRSMLPRVFRTNTNIRGVYASAAGNMGLIEFLEITKRTTDLTVIAHELTPSGRKALTNGTFDAIINQDTGHLVRSAIRVLTASVDKGPIDYSQERIRIDIYLKGNMPKQTILDTA